MPWLDWLSLFVRWFHVIAGIAWIGAVCRGGIHAGSIYLRNSEGLSERNLAILEEVARVVAGLRGPWLIGGD